jgi:recombination protein RecA
MFGNPETQPGGRALKFYASVRLDIRRIDQVKRGTEVVGNRTRVKVVKNKVAPPFRQAEFDILYGHGISNEGCILDLAVTNNIVDKSGSWFSYNGSKIAQGRDAAKQFLIEHPDVMTEIETKVRESYMPADDEGDDEVQTSAPFAEAAAEEVEDDILGIDV